MSFRVKPSPILAITLRWLVVQLVIVSFFLLLRGHDQPGGGFSGGLLAASGVIIMTIANGAAAGRQLLHFHPLSYIGTGLMMALFAGALKIGAPFLTSVWITVPLGITTLKLGSPLLFDMGVYLVVLGVLSSFVIEIESATHQSDNKKKERKP